MKVLVLGGNRYIGLRLIFELARQGHEVTVLNSHVAPMPEGTKRLHGDRHEPGVLQALLTPLRDEFDAVFDNTAYTPEHLEPTIEMFRGRVSHFVFTSSIAVYLPADAQPIDENYPVSDDPAVSLYGSYGAGKIRCEQLLAREHAENGLPFTVLRVAHSCGPMSPAVTREPGTFARIEQDRPLFLAGRTDAGVHLVHIEDVATAMCAVLGKTAAIGQTYNIAGSQFSSIEGYVRLMGKAVGKPANIAIIPPEIATTLPSPIVHWLEANHGGMIFSIEKARRDLGWEPGFTLETGLADSYRWFSAEGRDRYTYDFTPDEAILAEIDRLGLETTRTAARQGYGGNMPDMVQPVG